MCLTRADPLELHVFSRASSEVTRMLRFRDYLRTNPDVRERYAQTKRELAARTWKHVQHYADAKTEAIEALVAEAGGFGRL